MKHNVTITKWFLLSLGLMAVFSSSFLVSTPVTVAEEPAQATVDCWDGTTIQCDGYDCSKTATSCSCKVRGGGTDSKKCPKKPGDDEPPIID